MTALARIVEMLEARADTDEPLDRVEIVRLAIALRRLVGPPVIARQDNVLRPACWHTAIAVAALRSRGEAS